MVSSTDYTHKTGSGTNTHQQMISSTPVHHITHYYTTYNSTHCSLLQHKPHTTNYYTTTHTTHYYTTVHTTHYSLQQVQPVDVQRGGVERCAGEVCVEQHSSLDGVGKTERPFLVLFPNMRQVLEQRRHLVVVRRTLLQTQFEIFAFGFDPTVDR